MRHHATTGGRRERSISCGLRGVNLAADSGHPVLRRGGGGGGGGDDDEDRMSMNGG